MLLGGPDVGRDARLRLRPIEVGGLPLDSPLWLRRAGTAGGDEAMAAMTGRLCSAGSAAASWTASARTTCAGVCDPEAATLPRL